MQANPCVCGPLNTHSLAMQQGVPLLLQSKAPVTSTAAPLPHTQQTSAARTPGACLLSSGCAMQLAQHGTAQHAMRPVTAPHQGLKGTRQPQCGITPSGPTPTAASFGGAVTAGFCCTARAPTNTLHTYTCFIQRNAPAASNAAVKLQQALSTNHTTQPETDAGDTLHTAHPATTPPTQPLQLQQPPGCCGHGVPQHSCCCSSRATRLSRRGTAAAAFCCIIQLLLLHFTAAAAA